MNETYQLNKNVILTTVQNLVSQGKLHFIHGLNTVCSCGKSIKIHGSRYNKVLRKFETFCPDQCILVDKDFEIITSFTPETFNLIFSKREE